MNILFKVLALLIMCFSSSSAVASSCDSHAWGCDKSGNLQYPEAFAQTWKRAENGSLDISHEDTFIVTPNYSLGYTGGAPDKGVCSTNGTDTRSCIMKGGLRLDKKPSLNAPSNAKNISSLDEIDSAGTYKIGSIDGKDIDIAVGPVILYVDGNATFDGEDFSVLNNNPNNFILIAKNKVEIKKSDVPFVGHVIASEVQIQNNPVRGTVTADKFQYDNSNYENDPNTSTGEYCDPRAEAPCGAFPEQPPSLELCDIFPHVTQSWSADSLFAVTNGGSNIYGTKSDSGRVGFGYVTDKGTWQNACDGKRCVADSMLLIAEPDILFFSDGPYTQFDPDKRELPPGKYREIHVSGGDAIYNLTGTYYEIDSLSLSGSAKFLVKRNTFIKVNSLHLSNGAKILSTSGGNAEGLILWGETESNVTPTITISVSNLHANIFSRGSVKFTSGSTLFGSVSAFDVDMGGTKLERLEPNCGNESGSSIDSIVIEPNNYHLTCENSNKVYIYPFDSEGAPISDVGDESVEWSANTNTLVDLEFVQFDSTNKRFEYNLLGKKNDNNMGQVPISAHVVGESDVNDNNELIFVPFRFTINNGQDIALIAGQERILIPIEALACEKETGSPISGRYNVSLNTADVTSKGVVPVFGDFESLNLSAELSNGEGTMSIQLDESGEYKGELKSVVQCSDFANAIGCEEGDQEDIVGQFTLKSRPWKIAICNVQSSDGSRSNSGTTDSGVGFMPAGDKFNISYRPIIHPDGVEASIGGDECGYPVTANYALDNGPLSLTSIVTYPSSSVEGVLELESDRFSSSDTNGIKSTSENSWDEVGSFDLTTSATYLTMELDTDTETIGRFYPAYFELESEEWSYAEDHNGFAYMSQPIGHSFTVTAKNTKNSSTSNYGLFDEDLIANFGYLANDLGDTSNSNSLIDRVVDVAPNTDWNDGEWTGVGSTGNRQWGKNGGDTSQLALTFSEFSLEKQSVAHTSGNYTTTPDGPFSSNNSQFGLLISKKVDGVQFKLDDGNSGITYEDSALFSQQPAFRYGRMVLDDVGSTSGQTGLNIPLRVEYWDGSRFVTNTLDGGSWFNADDNYCTQVIWHSEGETETDVSLQGDGSMSSGEAAHNALIGVHSGGVDVREQVRTWLLMSSTEPTELSGENDIDCIDSTTEHQDWLRFNWRNNGDEAPSSILTFGIHRGNDRVIYRGEPGLSNQ